MKLVAAQEADYKHLAAVCQSSGTLLLHGASKPLAQNVLELLIARLLCEDVTGLLPCTTCSSCILQEAGNHPDLLRLSAVDAEERKYPSIKVQQIRDMLDFAATAPHRALRKIIYIADCKELGLSSANALLKILEEAGSYCLFIFYTQNLEGMLPTITSRMFKYKLATPGRELALNYLISAEVADPEFWLAYFNGEIVLEPPFSREQLNCLVESLLYPSIDSLFALSTELEPKDLGLDNLLAFLLKWLSDVALLNLGGDCQYFGAWGQKMHSLISKLNLAKLYTLVDEIILLRQWSEHPLNQKLQWENILFRYQQIYV